MQRWDGTLQVKSAGQYRVEPWRFEGSDNVVGTEFHFSTHPARVFGASRTRSGGCQRLCHFRLGRNSGSEFVFTTAQGDFNFNAGEIPYARGIYKLGGRVYVDRIPVALRVTDTPEEEDFPSLAAGPQGDVWLAYVQFHHSADNDRLRMDPPEIPKDFKPYAEPTGGDQIWVRRYSGREVG